MAIRNVACCKYWGVRSQVAGLPHARITSRDTCTHIGIYPSLMPLNLDISIMVWIHLRCVGGKGERGNSDGNDTDASQDTKLAGRQLLAVKKSGPPTLGTQVLAPPPRRVA